jgi:hypothetical protein
MSGGASNGVHTPFGDPGPRADTHAMDAMLADRIRRGEYVVDPHAVASALVERARIRRSAVLVAAQILAQELARAPERQALAGENAA